MYAGSGASANVFGDVGLGILGEIYFCSCRFLIFKPAEHSHSGVDGHLTKSVWKLES